MSDATPATENPAEYYEAHMVPAIFKPWATWFCDQLALEPQCRILDIACGTGALTRELAMGAASPRRIVGLDCNADKLEVAKRVCPALKWEKGNAEALPFKDASFDLVTCQFGLMLFDRPEAALREIRRVLALKGQAACLVWDLPKKNAAFAALDVCYEDQIGPWLAPILKGQYSFGDVGAIECALQGAGIPNCRIQTHQLPIQFPSAAHMVQADIKGWLGSVGVALTEQETQSLIHQAEKRLAAFIQPDGSLEFETSAHCVVFNH